MLSNTVARNSTDPSPAGDGEEEAIERTMLSRLEISVVLLKGLYQSDPRAGVAFARSAASLVHIGRKGVVKRRRRRVSSRFRALVWFPLPSDQNSPFFLQDLKNVVNRETEKTVDTKSEVREEQERT